MAGIVTRPGTITVNTGTSNIRVGMSTAAPIVLEISGINRFLISEEPVKDEQTGLEIKVDGYSWYYVESEAGLETLHGYIAKTNRITVAYDSVVEPPTEDLYELSINGATLIVGKVEWEQHVELARLWYESLRSLQPSKR